MTPNKFLFLLVCLVVGVYFYFNKPVPDENMVDFDETNIKTNFKKKQSTTEEVVKKFATSIAKNPEILNNIADSSNTLSVQEALDYLISEENASADFRLINRFKEVLVQKRHEALAMIFNRYLIAENTESGWEKQKLLALAIDLCNNEASPSCSEFLYNEALNKSLVANQQLAALKGYLNTKEANQDDMLELISAFRSSHSDSEINAELDNIEKYVRKDGKFMLEKFSEEGELERFPSSETEN
jgi:hypothetical protein